MIHLIHFAILQFVLLFVVCKQRIKDGKKLSKIGEYVSVHPWCHRKRKSRLDLRKIHSIKTSDPLYYLDPEWLIALNLF